MPDIPWHIVAIVFIAFVSWVYNKFQEVAAERKRQRFNAVKRSYDKRERQGQDARQTPPPPKPKSAVESILEGLGVPLEELRESEQEQKPPPPLPKKEPKLVAPSSDSRKPITPEPKVVVKKPSALKLRRKRRVAGIRKLLRGRDSLRQALIASEVLQKPKGLQD